MFTEAFFKEHQSYFTQPKDVWWHAFMRLHVLAKNVSNVRLFKIDAVKALRKSTVYKTTKLNAESVEHNLVDCEVLSLPAFLALAHLYHLHVTVVLGQLSLTVAQNQKQPPTHCVDQAGNIRPMPASLADCFHVVHVGKPLNALSYYTVAELEAIASKLRTGKGNKMYMYNGIQAYLEQKLTVLPQKKNEKNI